MELSISKRRIVAATVLVNALCSCIGSAQGMIAISEVEPAASSAPKVNWRETVDWNAEQALFKIGPDESPVVGKLVTSPEGIHLHVVVSDAEHYNPFARSNIWQGDCLQIGLDGRGDGPSGNPTDFRGTIDVDDFALGLALTESGPTCWVFVSHKEAEVSPGATDKFPFSIQRDDAAKQTTYEVTFPWDVLETYPGFHKQFGIAVQLNDSREGAEQVRYYYGRGADGAPRTGLFEQLSYDGSFTKKGAMAVNNTVAWSKSEPATISVAASGKDVATIEVTVGDAMVHEAVKAGSGMASYEVAVIPSTAEADVTVKLLNKSGEVVLEKTYAVTNAELSMVRFEDAVRASLEHAKHPLFVRHLKSIQSLVQSEWARMLLFREQNPAEALISLGCIKRITAGLELEYGSEEAYMTGDRDMILAYVSPHDRATQFYKFSLPKNWDPEKAYPLFFELHGAGSPNPLDGIASSVGADKQAPTLHGYSSNRTFAPIQGNGYWCQPFGRGNLGYRGIAEIDIFEAYDDLHKNFKVDQDRRYLYGFSMGGGGSWSVGLRTPDRWAAIMIFAGGVWREKPELNLARNILHLPVRIWCGEEDSLFNQLPYMTDELRAAGIEPEVSTSPGVGHNYLMEQQEIGINWLQQFVRKRPDSFTFATDQDSTNTAWGITVERNEALSGLPEVECRFEGDTIYINTKGAAAVRVNPFAEGLDFKDTLRVVVDGAEVYNDVPKTILIHEGKAIEFDPTRRMRSR